MTSDREWTIFNYPATDVKVEVQFSNGRTYTLLCGHYGWLFDHDVDNSVGRLVTSWRYL